MEMSKQLPRRVRVGHDYYEPVVLRIDAVRSDGKPDVLSHVAPEDVAELSADPLRNQFKVVYAPVGQFTSKHDAPADKYIMPDDESLNLLPLLKKHFHKDLALHLSFDNDQNTLRLIISRLVDGKADPIDMIHVGILKDPTKKAVITPHSLVAQMIQMILQHRIKEEELKPPVTLGKMPKDPDVAEALLGGMAGGGKTSAMSKSMGIPLEPVVELDDHPKPM
jgi:hypothetical protein